MIAKTISQGYSVKEFYETVQCAAMYLKKGKEIMSNQYEGVVFGLLPKEEQDRLRDSTKRIQFYSTNEREWRYAFEDCAWAAGEAYREKPEPKPKKWVPWECEDVPKNCFIVPKDIQLWQVITGIGATGVKCGDTWIKFYDLLNDYVQHPSRDPCGKEVDGDE